MAREPEISDAKYNELVKAVSDMGYDLSELRKVPQSW